MQIEYQIRKSMKKNVGFMEVQIPTDISPSSEHPFAQFIKNKMFRLLFNEKGQILIDREQKKVFKPQKEGLIELARRKIPDFITRLYDKDFNPIATWKSDRSFCPLPFNNDFIKAKWVISLKVAKNGKVVDWEDVFTKENLEDVIEDIDPECVFFNK